MSTSFSNIIAFDDAPFPHNYQGQVKIVGTVFASQRFDGLLIGEIEKDGSDATQVISQMISVSKFAEHIRLILLQGITMAGFNVVDIWELHEQSGLPVLVICRALPDLPAIQEALLQHIADGRRKWLAIQKAGAMESIENVYVQRAGISKQDAETVIKRLIIHSAIPEPIRIAHLIAGALAENVSRGGA